MSELIGTWDLHDSENWDEYLKALGVSYLNRKLIVNIRPQVVLLNEGKRWESKTYTSLRNTHKIYFDGEEFDEVTLDGRNSKSCVKSEGPNKLVHTQKDPETDEVVTVITREIIEDKLVQTFTIGSVRCRRVFKRSK